MGLISRVSSRTYRNQTPFKMAESYVEALEKKIAELAGIPMEAIRKNKWNDLMNEGARQRNRFQRRRTLEPHHLLDQHEAKRHRKRASSSGFSRRADSQRFRKFRGDERPILC